MAFFLIPTLSDSYYQTILTYLGLISNNIHTFTELIPNSSKHFFGSFNGHLNRKKILKEKKLFGARGKYIPWKIRIQIQTTTNLLG